MDQKYLIGALFLLAVAWVAGRLGVVVGRALRRMKNAPTLDLDDDEVKAVYARYGRTPPESMTRRSSSDSGSGGYAHHDHGYSGDSGGSDGGGDGGGGGGGD